MVEGACRMRSQAKCGAFFAALCACVLLFGCFGCIIPQCVGDGVYQADYWAEKGDIPKTREVLGALKEIVPKPSMPISDKTHYVVIHNIQEHKSLWSQITGVAAGFLGFSPGAFEAILGALVTALGGGGVWKLFREVRKRRHAEGRADKAEATTDDCYDVLDSQDLQDKTPAELKRQIAKRQANRYDGFRRNNS